jgi:DNA uptake protein ComE-like DNA-binding protein/competence protein ComGC
LASVESPENFPDTSSHSMRNKIRYWIRDFFTLNKSEQRGTIVLLVIILLLLLFNLLLPNFFSHKKSEFRTYNQEVSQFLQTQKSLTDSLQLIHLQNAGKLSSEQANAKLHPVPFDPNHLSVEKGLQMGLSARQVKTIQHYVARGGRFRKKEDLKKIHGLSAVEYDILKSYIRIAPFKNSPHKNYQHRKQPTRIKMEINSADSAALVQKLLLPPWLALRILKYRTLLGGFYSRTQLREVYGMKTATYDAIQTFVRIDTSKIKKTDLNTTTFKQLLHHPYISYETTKKLINARERAHGFIDFRQVKEMTGLPDSLLNKIRHYLYLRPLKN